MKPYKQELKVLISINNYNNNKQDFKSMIKFLLLEHAINKIVLRNFFLQPMILINDLNNINTTINKHLKLNKNIKYIELMRGQ